MDVRITNLDVPLCDETREHFYEIAARSRKSEAEIAAALIDRALAEHELEVQIIRDRIAQADVGGRLDEDVLAPWNLLGSGKTIPTTQAGG